MGGSWQRVLEYSYLYATINHGYRYTQSTKNMHKYSYGNGTILIRILQLQSKLVVVLTMQLGLIQIWYSQVLHLPPLLYKWKVKTMEITTNAYVWGTWSDTGCAFSCVKKCNRGTKLLIQRTTMMYQNEANGTCIWYWVESSLPHSWAGPTAKGEKNGSALQSESNREAAIPMSQHKLVDSNKINTNYQSTFIGMMHGS